MATIRTRLSRLGLVAGFSVSAISLVSLAAAWWWPLGMLEHLRAWYFVLLVPIALLAALRYRRLAILILVVAVFNAGLVVPHLRWRAEPTTDADLRIVSANLDRHARPDDEVVSGLLAGGPDLVLLFEVTPEWLETIEAASPGYEVIEAVARDDSRGVAALAPQAPGTANATVIQLLPGITDRPMLTVDLQRGEGAAIRVLGFHTKRPIGAEDSRLQALEYEALAEWLASKANGPPTLALGDFNATPWSRLCHRLVADSGHRSAKRNWPTGTWPAWLPRALQLPIDHCVAHPSLQVVGCRPGHRTGSDHLPLVVSVR